LVSRLKGFIYKYLFGHDAIYDSDYYASSVEDPAARSAEAISESILLDLQPSTVVDVGCGTGALLEALRRRGCQVFGFEYSEAALRY
jgi:SAM-dependent methyltransferase